MLWAPAEGEEMPDSFARLDNISIVQPRQQVEWDPDVQQMHKPLSDDEDASAAQKALEIWKQLTSDVIQKIGNPMGTTAHAQEESYCHLHPSDHIDVIVETMQDPNLAKNF
ncbi:hypothetical protein APHAL10511_006899 [Amanita phalloides]|nr:hypothetical protein APHAL10511_006899 [Amanita phalloides]